MMTFGGSDENYEPITYAKDMYLRDYFAAKAMQGDLSHNGCMNVYETARFAYELADAMMKARDE